MKLFVISGVTSLNTHFPIFFALGAQENNEFMDWAIRKFEEMGSAEPGVPRVPYPHRYITDYSKAMKRALRSVFPEAQAQLCIWHNYKNVVKYIKDHWAGSRVLANAIDPQNEAITDFLSDPVIQNPEERRQVDRGGFTHTPEGLLAMWKALSRANDVEDAEAVWGELKAMFEQSQPGIYLQPFYYHRPPITNIDSRYRQLPP